MQSAGSLPTPKLSIFFPLFIVLCTMISTSTTLACDLCAIYTSVDATKFEPHSFSLGLAEQYAAYDEIRDRGHKIDNLADQYLHSSTMQLHGTYVVSDSFAIQGTLPIIHRSFKRAEGGEIETGHEAGVGDMSFLGRYRIFNKHEMQSTLRIEIYGGIKLPTGDSERLREELSEEEEEGTMPSAVHGHDLALGTGSIDFPVGAAFFGQYGRGIVSAEAQYIIRTDGSYDYRYADDFSWAIGAGAYVLPRDESSLAIKVNLSGETKGRDSRKGERFGDTSITQVFLGPELVWTSGDRFSLETALDLPIYVENGEVQATPTSRVRMAVSYRF